MPTPTAKPRTKSFNLKALTVAIDGPEKAYPVYQFGRGKRFEEKPKHNPFAGL